MSDLTVIFCSFKIFHLELMVDDDVHRTRTIAGPDVFGMILQEDDPGLRGSFGWANECDVFLNGMLGNRKAEFEEFAAELGPRTQTLAHGLIRAPLQTLDPGCVPVFTSDSLNLYFYSLTAHFGTWVETGDLKKREWQVAASLLYGQLIKSYRRRKLTRVERVMRWDPLESLKAKLQQASWSGVLHTAFVEHVNLTVRRDLAIFARRSWSTPQTVTDHCWTVVELLSFPVPA